jgi:hypothetical protein
MNWKQVGYFPKQRSTRSHRALRYPDQREDSFFGNPCSEGPVPFFGNPCSERVEEICSVSDCIVPGPDRWRDQGKHNFHDMYDTPELAWSVVPVEARADFELFAYQLLLLEFAEGREESMEDYWELSEVSVAPMTRSFVRLGWDAVVGGNHVGFGCSPMSCNIGCKIVEIAKRNRYCLVSTEQEGIALARHFSICQPEPGPYCVVEVWREAVSSVAPVN